MVIFYLIKMSEFYVYDDDDIVEDVIISCKDEDITILNKEQKLTNKLNIEYMQKNTNILENKLSVDIQINKNNNI